MPDKKKTEGELLVEAQAVKKARVADAKIVLGLPPEE
jgi:hypothetical protein